MDPATPPYRVLPPTAVDDLTAYERAGGGSGLQQALARGPDATVAELARARLRGRGGGGFPIAVKWRRVRDAARRRGEPAFVVANVAEGEPGSYKDRHLLETVPHVVVEGTLIALHAVGARQAVIAVKERNDRGVGRLRDALAEIRAAGWARADDVEVALGPDDYLFGQETALLEVLEGRPALPRVLRPDQRGLFAGLRAANPTAVDNVETLAHAAAILGGDANRFLRTGTDATPGTILCTVVGDVARPGVRELAAGTPLRTLVVDLAGADDILAVLGGASGAIVTDDQLDTPLEYDAMRSAGLELGSGGFVVVDHSRCIVQVLTTFVRFLALESCGQCVACRVGTTEIADRLHRIDQGSGSRVDLERIAARARWLTDGARCRLPGGAERLVVRALERFGDTIAAHVGTACRARPIRTPLIDTLDPDTGEVVWHPGYDSGVPTHARRRGMPR
ncbi:MAG: hypothetical protein KY460_13205 [Actinobacteria bacterium]|nr:hypothetical protein [Actinomycetota bacterium]